MVLKRLVSLLFALLIVATISLDLEAEARNKKSMGTPDDSVLVFGYIRDIYSIRFTQIDPDFEPDYYQSSDMLFTFDNVEPGGYLKMTTYRPNDGLYTPYSPGLSGKSTLDFRVPDKPGLYYVGFMVLSCCERNMLIFKPGDKKYTELMVLTWLLPSVKNKAWVPVIESRIKELESEEK